MKHYWDASGCQHQAGEGIDRSRACSPVKGHPKADRSLLTGEAGTASPVHIKHAGQFLGFRSADAVGDEKGADLGRTGTAVKDQIQGMGGLFTTETTAGVLAAADLSQVPLEDLSWCRSCWAGGLHGPQTRGSGLAAQQAQGRSEILIFEHLSPRLGSNSYAAVG